MVAKLFFFFLFSLEAVYWWVPKTLDHSELVWSIVVNADHMPPSKRPPQVNTCNQVCFRNSLFKSKWNESPSNIWWSLAQCFFLCENVCMTPWYLLLPLQSLLPLCLWGHRESTCSPLCTKGGLFHEMFPFLMSDGVRSFNIPPWYLSGSWLCFKAAAVLLVKWKVCVSKRGASTTQVYLFSLTYS